MKRRKTKIELPYEIKQMIFKANKYSPLYKYYNGPKKTRGRQLNYLLENLKLLEKTHNTYTYLTDNTVFVIERRDYFDFSELANVDCKIVYFKYINRITNHYNIKLDLKKLVIYRCNITNDDNLFYSIKAKTVKIKYSYVGVEPLEMKNVERFYSRKNYFLKKFTSKILKLNNFSRFCIEENDYEIKYKPGKLHLWNYQLNPYDLKNLSILKLKNTGYKYDDIRNIIMNNPNLIRLDLKCSYKFEELNKIFSYCKRLHYLDLYCGKKENIGFLINGIFKMKKTLRTFKIRIKNFNMLLLKDIFCSFLRNCKIFLN